MKPILILSNMYPARHSPSHGIFVKNAEQLLLDSGADVAKVVVAGRYASYLKKLFVYVSYMVRAFVTLLFTRRLIYIHYVAHSSIPLLLLSIIRPFDVVSHVHGGDVLPATYEPEPVRKVKRWLAAKTLKLSKCIVVPSAYFKDLVASEFGIPEELIVVSPSGGVDTSFFTYKNPTINDKPVFGYVGRLDKGKGVDTLIKALSKLEFEFECQIIGHGTESEYFRQLVAELSLQGRVSFLGGKAQSELPSFYQSFNWLIFPSEMQESLGLVGLEAMSCGRPVIGSMMAGMTDYMAPERNALGFEVGNADSLAQAMTVAAELKEEEYQQYCRKARETAERFDAKLTNEGLQSILTEQ